MLFSHRAWYFASIALLLYQYLLAQSELEIFHFFAFKARVFWPAAFLSAL